MEDLFAVCARRPPPAQRVPLAYRVIKINQAGKHQNRTFRLTTDSLLNLDGSTIRTEVAFSGIESVRLDAARRDRLYLKYKAEDFEKPIICRDAPLLYDAFMRALHIHAVDEEIEESSTISEGRRETMVDLATLT